MRTVTMVIAIAVVVGACGGSTAEPTPETTTPSVETSTTSAAAAEPEPTTTGQGPVTNANEASSSQPQQVWPGDRIHPTLLEDPVSGQMLMVGGLSRMGQVMDMRDAWLLDTIDFSWTHLADGAPDNAFNFGMDTESAHVVALNLIPGETWTFDVCTNEWTQMSPTGDIAGELSAGLVYDADSDLTVAFGYGRTFVTQASRLPST